VALYIATYVQAGAKRERVRLQISGGFSLTAPDGGEMILNTENPWPTLATLLSLQYLPIEALTIDHGVLLMRVGGWSSRSALNPRAGS
jgi:hypothetical protein